MVEIYDSVMQNFTEAMGFYISTNVRLYNCKLKNVNTLGLNCEDIKCYNCTLENSPLVVTTYDSAYTPNGANIEFFDLNGVIGNYASAQMFGSIITDTVNKLNGNNTLHFNLTYDRPVWKDYIINVPANRTIRFLTTVQKDFDGGNVKLQIIDPSSDPLRAGFSTYTALPKTNNPLSEVSMPDIKNIPQQLGIAYKSTVAKQLILRVLCQNASGNVLIDVTRIEQAMGNHKIVS